MASETLFCSVCPERKNLKACSGCYNSRYCSRECQQRYWKVHKYVYKAFADFPVRPNELSKRGVYFPETEEKPRFIWLSFKQQFEEGEGLYELPELGDFRGNGQPLSALLSIRTFQALKRPLAHTTDLMFRDAFLIDGSASNLSINRLLGAGPGHDWRGPVVAVGMEGTSSDPHHGRDLDTSDFRHIVDFLIHHTI